MLALPILNDSPRSFVVPPYLNAYSDVVRSLIVSSVLRVLPNLTKPCARNRTRL